MADILEYMESRPEWLDERLELARGRLSAILSEEKNGLLARAFWEETALFMQDALRVFDLKEAQMLEGLSFERQRGVQEQLAAAPVWRRLYREEEIAGEAELDRLLRTAAKEWKLAGSYALFGEKLPLVICLELFLQIYQLFEMEKRGEESREELKGSVHQALYYHFSDYCDVTTAFDWRARLVPGPYTEAVETAGAEDVYGLYRLGWPADEGAVREAERLARFSDKEMEREALACLQEAGWEAGNPAAGIFGKLASLEVVPGMERLAKRICGLLRTGGYEPVCFRPAGTLMNRAAAGERPPELFLFLDKALKERRVAEEKNALEVYKKEASQLALRIRTKMRRDPERKGETENGEPQGKGGPSRRQERLYQEFQQELSAVREKFFGGY